MSNNSKTTENVKQAVPFFMVTDINASLTFYVKGLGFELKDKWEPAGKIAWCLLQLGNATIMLQEYNTNVPAVKLGEGVTVCFICEDALRIYKEIISRGFLPTEPFVGNNMWVVNLWDPDGYKLIFESATDVPEETKYSELKEFKAGK